MSTTEAITAITTEPAIATDSGANFRESQPIQPVQTDNTTTTDAGTETGEGADTSGRFGVAGKSTSKISFRILSNGTLTFKPYAGLSKKKCIKPGGVEGAIKPFTSSSGRKQFKKVGIRIAYSTEQLFSVQNKLAFKILPLEIETIDGVFEEGLGDFEAYSLLNGIVQVSTTEKIAESKLKKATDLASKTESVITTTITTSEATSTYKSGDRYEGDDTKAANLRSVSRTASKFQSKLKKTDKVDDIVDIQKEDIKIKDISTKDIKEKPLKMKEVKQSTINTREEPAKSGKPLSSFRSTGAWSGSRRNQDPMARLKASITSRLNKITLDNFSNLSDQLIQIFETEITNTEQLTKLVTLIFEKTVQEHVYGPLYAKLCVALSSKNKIFDEIVFIDGAQQTRKVDFKNVLVKVCQNEFQKGKRAAVFTDDMDATDRENEVIKQKKILLGTMKFIGQLYLKELIPSKIMTVCLKHLIYQATGKPTEDDVEAACTLLKTVGPTLDEDATVNKNELGKYFKKLRNIEANSNKYSVRIRMLVQNLLDLRKNDWIGNANIKNEGPKKLDRNKPSATEPDVSDMYDPYDEFEFDLETLMRGTGANDGSEIINVVPVAAHVVGQSQRQFALNNRYSRPAAMSAVLPQSNTVHLNHPEKRPNPQRKKGRSRKRQLLPTTQETEERMEEIIDDFKQNENVVQTTQTLQIGQRKSRMKLSSSAQRPCTVGKSKDDEDIEALIGDYLNLRNNVNESQFIQTLKTYQLPDRIKFITTFIRSSIDGGKGERGANMVPKLLNEYILLPSELDEGFIEFFKGYTFEDNPQLALNTAQILAPLIIDNELNFNDVLNWILLDTRQHQPQSMLQYYDGDGVRNYCRKLKESKITIVMQLLGELFKELKEICFEDSQYVNKLVKQYNFTIDQYLNQDDLNNKQEIQQSWIKQYSLKFAF